MSTFTPFEEKMESAGVPAAAVKAFSRCYEALVSNHSGMIPEMDIQPADQVEDWQDITASTPAADKDLISQCVCIKLNGGLGTSMGLQKAKSLLKVKGEDTFLDLIVRQVKHLRSISGTPVRLLLMNSFSTSADTLAYLEKYASDGFADPAQVELMQNRVPKILADGLAPASCPEQPELEWCPPGHGDLYPALLGSGWLDRLLADGVKYAFVSNSDNLGAQLDMNFLRWFAESGAPFVMEVTRRTEADKKGGHLAVRKADGHLILREVAQCPDADIPEFQNISKHRYFNTNTLWIRLDALKEILDANGGVLPLPMIRNSKTLNPRDPESAPVYQLETAMGAGIECFPGARAVNVPRSRFFPVKTTSDLLLLRSDAIAVDEDGKVALAPEREGKTPVVDLDSKLYKLVDSLDSLGLPSLIGLDKLTLRGRFYDTITPYLPAPLWAMQAAALVPAVLCLIAGSRCLKHAAVIVTPVGVEILPFLRARRAMQWCFWQQIRSADRKGGRLNLRLTDGSTVAVSLRSMTAASREMLVHAVRQRVNTLQCSGYGKA